MSRAAGVAGYEYPDLPAELREGLRAYADTRLPQGGLLTAVLENDLHGAVTLLHRSLGIRTLRDLCWYVNMEIPSVCHGSPAAVAAWLAGAPGSGPAPEFVVQPPPAGEPPG